MAAAVRRPLALALAAEMEKAGARVATEPVLVKLVGTGQGSCADSPCAKTSAARRTVRMTRSIVRL